MFSTRLEIFFVSLMYGKKIKKPSRIRTRAVVKRHALLTREAYVALITCSSKSCRRHLQNAGRLTGFSRTNFLKRHFD